jgi:ubiquinone/menaquinone biosynthesis C-methylase UbiE
MDATREGQVSATAAEVYETFFVPALFAEWAPRVADAAAFAPGDRVVDVACGTGAVAREAARRVAPGGIVVGLDRNDGMLAVARRLCPGVEWRQGRAEALPIDTGSQDAVTSQFGLMFFEDRVAALREMWRILRPGGRLAVAVWDTLERTPGYAAMTALIDRLFGAAVAEGLRAPYVLGDPDELLELFSRAGIPGVRLRTLDGVARFPSVERWVQTDVKGWTLADLIDDAQYARLQAAAPEALASFVRDNGAAEFAAPAHIVSATKA